MAKFDVGRFISGTMQAVVGQVAGTIAAEAELMRRKQEQDERQRSFIQSILPTLSQGSQQDAIGYLGQQIFGQQQGGPSQPLQQFTNRLNTLGGPTTPAPVAPPAVTPQGPTALGGGVYGETLQGPPAPSFRPLPPGMSGPPTPAIPPVAGYPVERRLGEPVATPAPPAPAAPAPTAPPSAAGQPPTTPAPRRGLTLPGGPTLQFRGVDPNAVTELRKRHAAAMSTLSKANLSPADREITRRWASQVSNNIDTEEKLQQAQDAVSQLEQASFGMGPAVISQANASFTADKKTIDEELAQVMKSTSPDQFLALAEQMLQNEQMLGERAKQLGRTFMPLLSASRDDIEALRATQDPVEREKLFNQIKGRVGGGLTTKDELDVVNLFSKMARDGMFQGASRAAIRKWFEQKGAPYLADAFASGTLPGTAELEKRYQALLAQMGDVGKTTAPKDQKPFLNELRTLATMLGRDPKAIPNVITPTMTLKETKALERALSRETQQDRQFNARLEFDKTKFAFQKQQKAEAKREKALTLTPFERQQLSELKDQRNKLFNELQGIYKDYPVNLQPFKPESPASVRANALKAQIAETTKQIKDLTGRIAGAPLPKPTPQPGAAKPQQSVKSPSLANQQRAALVQKLQQRGLSRADAEAWVGRYQGAR